MAKDFPISLCGQCELRPIDPETIRRVEGRLRVGERSLAGGALAAVIYSAEDPRINYQFMVTPGKTTDEAVRLANTCTTAPEGLEAGLGATEDRIKAQQAAAAQHVCRIAGILHSDLSLPADLLYQTQPQDAA